jgi:hypothetical protein
MAQLSCRPKAAGSQCILLSGDKICRNRPHLSATGLDETSRPTSEWSFLCSKEIPGKSQISSLGTDIWDRKKPEFKSRHRHFGTDYNPSSSLGTGIW